MKARSYSCRGTACVFIFNIQAKPSPATCGSPSLVTTSIATPCSARPAACYPDSIGPPPNWRVKGIDRRRCLLPMSLTASREGGFRYVEDCVSPEPGRTRLDLGLRCCLADRRAVARAQGPVPGHRL